MSTRSFAPVVEADGAARACVAVAQGEAGQRTVTVNASADASAQGLTRPYAGGQVARGGRTGILGTKDPLESPFSTTSCTNELIQDRQGVMTMIRD